MAKVLSTRKQTPRKFKIEITEGEADFLLAMVSHAGGDREHSPRKYAHRLTRMLEKMTGYKARDTDAQALVTPGDFVWFHPYDPDQVPEDSLDELFAREISDFVKAHSE